MISRPQIFRNRNVFLIHKRFKRRGKVIHRRLRRSIGLPRRRMNNFENGIRGEKRQKDMETRTDTTRQTDRVLVPQAAQKLSGSADDEMTLVGYFLIDIRALMLATNADRILTRHIIAILNPKHDRAWEDLRRGREIN